MPKRDIVVIGASAGGVQVLQEIVQGLPRDYPGTIFVVLHTGPGSVLPEILNRADTVPTLAAEHNVRYEPNRIYVAPANPRLLINDCVMQLDTGARENGSRPSVDPLFRSAARTHRSRVVGVILSGTLDDGSAGLFAIKTRGGVAIVQDPAEATASEMPLNAMRNMQVDYCVLASQIPPLLTEVASADAPSEETNRSAMNEQTEELIDRRSRWKAPRLTSGKFRFPAPSAAAPSTRKNPGGSPISCVTSGIPFRPRA